MMTLTTFRKRVEQFMQDHGLSATTFGRDYASDPNFVADLRSGREPREATKRKVLDAMKARARADA
jgi:2,4-dienoyl-CoA reductase-like NADH-dependent reductase (Old Yellow Enzyme family)